MHIQSINSVNFQKKFRVHQFSFSRPVGDKILTTSKYREYNNPKAEAFYELAQKTKDPKEKEVLLNSMGDYELIEETTSMDKILPWIREALCKKRPE